jgi:hypothetical protein
MQIAAEELKSMIEGLITRGDRLSQLYLSGAALALTVATLKFQGKEKKFKFFEISFRLDQYWIAAFAYSIVHIYLSSAFVSACHRFLELSSAEKRSASDSLTFYKAPFIFQDLPLVVPTGEKYHYNFPLNNPATVLLIGILIIFATTIIKGKIGEWKKLGFSLVGVFIIFVINFMAGEWWMIELSKALLTSG